MVCATRIPREPTCVRGLPCSEPNESELVRVVVSCSPGVYEQGTDGAGEEGGEVMVRREGKRTSEAFPSSSRLLVSQRRQHTTPWPPSVAHRTASLCPRSPTLPRPGLVPTSTRWELPLILRKSTSPPRRCPSEEPPTPPSMATSRSVTRCSALGTSRL
jgi:hypothetical protein